MSVWVNYVAFGVFVDTVTLVSVVYEPFSSASHNKFVRTDGQNIQNHTEPSFYPLFCIGVKLGLSLQGNNIE
jgi:hypothetical protein